jgi:hypothetical protein
VYEDEGYTGFLPVNLTIHPPNFVHQWGIENSEGIINFQSLPIDQSGVYKFLYNGGQEGPFALGYIPVRRYDSTTEDFDFSINIPEKLIELEPGQVIHCNKNKRTKTFTVYDDESDSDMDIEETDDQPLIQLNQQRRLLKLRDSNNEESNDNESNDTSYRNIGEFTIDVNIPIYDGYDQSNPLTITQNGSGVISIPQNYEGLGEINYEINVPQQSAVNNYTQSTVTTNGTYTIPNGYTGFNDFTVDVPNSTTTKTITSNGTYTPSSPYIGFSSVTVNFKIKIKYWSDGISGTKNLLSSMNTSNTSTLYYPTSNIEIFMRSGYWVIRLDENHNNVNFTFNKPEGATNYHWALVGGINGDPCFWDENQTFLFDTNIGNKEGAWIGHEMQLSTSIFQFVF